MDLISAFKSVSRQVRDAALAVDPEGTVMFVSPYLERVLPNATSECLGQPVRDVLPVVAGEDPAVIDAVVVACRQGRAWEAPANLQTQLSGGCGGLIRVAPLSWEGYRLGATVTALTIDGEGNLLCVPREITRRFQVMVEASPDFVFALDRNNRIEYANRHARGLLGLSLAEIVGRMPSDLFPAEAYEHQNASLERVRQTGEMYRVTSPVTVGDCELWLDTCLVPVKDASGTATSVVGVSRDVSDLKRAEGELQQSEERLRVVLESTDDIVLLSDAEGQIVYYNGPSRYGVPRDAVAGTEIGAFFPPEQSEEMLRQLRQVVETGRTMTFETSVTWQGEEEWFSDNRSPVHGPDGSIAGVATISRNITALKRSENALRRSEALYRTALDAVQAWMFVVDGDLKVLVANRSLREALRRAGRPEDVTGLPVSVAFPDFPSEMVNSYEELLVTGRKQTTVESVHLGDSVLTLETTKAPVFENGQVVQVVTSMHDVTDLKRAEETHRLATLGQVAAGVAHEFNNLLAGMMAKADLAADTSAGDLPEFITRACAHGAEVCRSLLAFGKPSEPSQEPIYVEQVMEAAISLAAGRLHKTNVIVRRTYQTEGERICADGGQLGQVFLNLIINACDAMCTNGRAKAEGTLTVGTEPLRKGGSDWVCVTVADTGCGIAPDNLARIFEPFFTTKGDPAQGQRGGTGLGLSVSQRIVAAHAGTMEVRSSLGSGTTFSLCFPAYKARSSSAEAPESQAQPGGKVEHPSQPSRAILLAEDDEDLVVLFGAILAHEGHNVTMAMTTAEAVAKLQSARFDLVLSDLLLPGGGGREILAEAGKLAAPPPVIIMTGMNDSGTARELVELGAARFLDKPVSRNALLEAVAEVLGKR
ncbi:PAS domain-containing protein [bacterium]|nr:PAS domain-containing protein [bacterium]